MAPIAIKLPLWGVDIAFAPAHSTMPSSITLSQLVKEVANSHASDAEAQRGLLEKLSEVKMVSRSLRNPELGFMLDVAADLMRYLADDMPPTPESLLNMVTRLVVNAECTMYRCMENPEPQGHAPEKGGTRQEEHIDQPASALPAEDSTQDQEETAPLKLQFTTPEFDSNNMSQMRLGQVLVNLGLVNPEQVFEALSHQQDENLRMGEALASLGHLVPADLRHALGLQTKMREFADGHHGQMGAVVPSALELDEWQESLLGAVLVANRAITGQELKKGLAIQSATGMRLGEALVHHGLTDWRAIRNGIRTQERMRHVGNRSPSMRVSPKNSGA